MEASVSAGKEIGNTPTYTAKFGVKGTSPIDILSGKFEGMWIYFFHLISVFTNP